MTDRPAKSIKLYLHERDAALYPQAKIAAIRRGITLGQWVAEALREKLDESGAITILRAMLPDYIHCAIEGDDAVPECRKQLVEKAKAVLENKPPESG